MQRGSGAPGLGFSLRLEPNVGHDWKPMVVVLRVETGRPPVT